MWKKIVWGVLLAGLIGVLVFGAVNRTLARSSQEGGGTLRQGQTAEAGEEGASALRQGFGQSGQGQGSRQGQASQPNLQAEVQEWLTWEGSTQTVDGNALNLINPAGETLEIAHRAWSFALEQGVTIQAGDRVLVTGFYDQAGAFEAAQIENLTSSQTVRLRDENGFPLWSGRRRGSQ